MSENEKTPSKAATRRKALDAELEEYRTLVDVPDQYEEGFTWISVAGALFCGLLMFPGAIYLGLLAGVGMNKAATWVTVIIFSEVMRRAMKAMTKGEMVILLTVAGAMIGGNAVIPGGPFGQLIYRQYLVQSDAVKDAGLYGQFPSWFAPAPDSGALTERSFFHSDWIVPIVLLVYMQLISIIKTWTLGYGLFRLASDVEKLPFPMAPVGAQGVTALAEGEKGERTWRWTAFSIGTVLGLLYGVIQVGVPAISSAFLEKPIFVVPLPWFEMTPVTEGILPAMPTGIVFDLGLILLGFVIPFWAVMGAVFSVLFTLVANPLLYHFGILTSWQPGMDTINTQVANKIDFYFSAELGIALGIAVVSLGQTALHVRRALREAREKKQADPVGASSDIWATPEGRGDWSIKLCLVGYFIASGSVVALTSYLVPQFRPSHSPYTFVWLLLFAYLYTPLVSYLNARIVGLCGQHVTIPFVREGFILLSGAKGVEVWLAPMPIENYGSIPQNLRTVELTGVRFPSKVKAMLLTRPLIFILSFVFWSFLWADGPIPSDMYPFAQKMWDLQAKNTMIMWSATTGAEGTVTLFERSFHPEYLGLGFIFSIVMFCITAAAGLPTMLVYGMARGLAQGIPHMIIFEALGALLARYYFHKKFGKKPFLRTAPILLAGYFVGTGLIGMAAVAVRLISSAVSMAPF